MDPWMLAFQWVAIFVLISLSGTFSGLNLGLMGIDMVALQCVMESGSEREKAYAKAIYPVRQRGNYLLCTILLGNVAVNSALSILMADYTDGILGFFISTGIIVIFGEIVPQAVCSRHGLAIGARTINLMKFFMLVTFPLSYPISLILDRVLGHEIGTIYSKMELKKFLDIHRERKALTKQETVMLSGALDLSNKMALDIMTPLRDVFLLEVTATLDFETMDMIVQTGHSRIPVFEGNRNTIIGLLFVKDLVLLNPDDKMSLRTILPLCGRRMPAIFDDTPLDQILNEFKKGASHMALVHRVNADGPGDPFYETLGVLTLEDVIEELIGDEIIDETDVYVDVSTRSPIQRDNVADFARWRRERLRAQLSPEQARALRIYLREQVAPFSKEQLSDAVFERLILQGSILEIQTADDDRSPKYLYTRGEESTFFTLVLQGKLEVLSGEEEFRSEAGPFSVLGVRALASGVERFAPDFSARVVPPKVQVFRLSAGQWDAGTKATRLERIMHPGSPALAPHDDGGEASAAGIGSPAATAVASAAVADLALDYVGDATDDDAVAAGEDGVELRDITPSSRTSSVSGLALLQATEAAGRM